MHFFLQKYVKNLILDLLVGNLYFFHLQSIKKCIGNGYTFLWDTWYEYLFPSLSNDLHLHEHDYLKLFILVCSSQQWALFVLARTRVSSTMRFEFLNYCSCCWWGLKSHRSKSVLCCQVCYSVYILRRSIHALTVFNLLQGYFHVKLKNISLKTFFPKMTFSFAIFTLKNTKDFQNLQRKTNFDAFFYFFYSENNFLAIFESTGVIAGVHTLL